MCLGRAGYTEVDFAYGCGPPSGNSVEGTPIGKESRWLGAVRRVERVDGKTPNKYQ